MTAGSALRLRPLLMVCGMVFVASNCLAYFFDDEEYSAACQTRDDAEGRTVEECQGCVRDKWESHLTTQCPSQNQLDQFCVQSARMHDHWRADPSKKPKTGLHVTNAQRKLQRAADARRLAELQQKKADAVERNKREAEKVQKAKATKAKAAGQAEVAADGSSSTKTEGVKRVDQSNKLEMCLSYFFRDLSDSAACQNRDNIGGSTAKTCKACVRAQWKTVLKPRCDAFKKKMLIKFCDQALVQHKMWIKDPAKKPANIKQAVAQAWEPPADSERLDVADADELEPDLPELDENGKPLKPKKGGRAGKGKKARRRRRGMRENAKTVEAKNADGTESQHSQVQDQSDKLEKCLGFFFRDHGDASAGCQNRDEWLSPGIPSPTKEECQSCVRAKWSTHLQTPCDLYPQDMLETFCQQAAELHIKWRKDPQSKNKRG